MLMEMNFLSNNIKFLEKFIYGVLFCNGIRTMRPTWGPLDLQHPAQLLQDQHRGAFLAGSLENVQALFPHWKCLYLALPSHRHCLIMSNQARPRLPLFLMVSELLRKPLRYVWSLKTSRLFFLMASRLFLF